ncbi:hypothetical protein [Halodesulfovibrio sp. MK-HDV]|jgi:hypothetical protein|uniref:hypothetical protein n=1 Tax=unclassified Halodesulfovibrio TaxID=2644657 RepID=UPI00136DA578|nr:hypothetical protein [Halodesulfovibrio sp. MK-HDV]KAF1077058.1 hypothetical protein MKHDV_00655 [Halodesulfovibrio sp. MK-HDV]
MEKNMLAAILEGSIHPLPITKIPFTDTAVTQAMHLQLGGHITGKQVIVIE